MVVSVLKSNKFISFCYLISNSLKRNRISYLSSFSTSSVKRDEEVIEIPKRIERGPTDILRALADITPKDMTGPQYQYVDDPFLTPYSNWQKRTFALSKESGRRSAKYVFDEFPELFIRDDSEPKIEAFTYKEIISEDTKVDEMDLKKCIIRKEVNNSMVCYKNLVRDSIEISSESLHKLLELVCFYNCDEPKDTEFVVEQSFGGERNQRIQRILWKDNGFAEQLFRSIENKTSQTYCALIQGMAKYSQPKRAHNFYEEMIEKGFHLNTETYNSLITLAPMLRESVDLRWLYIEDLLKQMRTNRIKPNLQTFNNILEVITRFGSLKLSHILAKKVLVEMTNKLRIEPSLATYYHILNIFCRDRGPNVPVLYEIMDTIENQEFVIRDPKDVYFFVHAMTVCNLQLTDLKLGYRINDLVSVGKNYNLMGNKLNENNYYQHFFRLLSTAEEIKIFMEVYEKYVPHVYIPDPPVLMEILKMIDLYDAIEYLPRLWEDFSNFEIVTNIKLMEILFQLMAKNKVQHNLTTKFSEIVTEALKIIDDKITKHLNENHLMFNQISGELLGFAIEVYLNAKHTDNAIKLFDKFRSDHNKFIGDPGPQTLIRLCITGIDEKKYGFVKNCIEYCNEISVLEVPNAIIKHISGLDLEPNIKQFFEELCPSVESIESVANEKEE